MSALTEQPRAASARWRRLARRARRRVLAHRRLLAALLTAVAALSALRTLAPPPPATVEVLVAARDLPAGSTLGSEDVTAARFPVELAPDGAVVAPVGSTLAAPMRVGEPITDARLTGEPAHRPPAGTVATPVRFPDPAAVALLRPGDRIDVFATDPRRGHTTLVAGGALVLAVPPEGEDTATGPLGGRLALLALPASSVENVLGAAARLFLGFTYGA